MGAGKWKITNKINKSNFSIVCNNKRGILYFIISNKHIKENLKVDNKVKLKLPTFHQKQQLYSLWL